MPFNRHKPVNPETFQCDRYCGECCKKPFVLLSNEDIARIRNLGYEDDEFMEKESIGQYIGKWMLKKTGRGWCVFLEKDKKDNKGMYSCKIHSVKPETCRKYPFIGIKVDDCRPSTWPDFKPFHEIIGKKESQWKVVLPYQ